MADGTPKWQEIAQDLLSKLNELATLEIITGVGDTTVFKMGQDPKDRDQIYKTFQIDKLILTRINLIQGDITTIYHQ